ncbi:hypothetical protein CYLTODRAFT_323481, partial [Cylindrobasidium torrendii FP15055 ss-10]
GGDPGKIASDLWYEQARTAVSKIMRKGCKLETVQTLLLLAMRDHGNGAEGQAWLLVGAAVRIGQELNLAAATRHSPDDVQLRQNVWGVTLILDLVLSLQMGKSPAIADTLRAGPILPELLTDELFAQEFTLCHIISRINLHLHLG